MTARTSIGAIAMTSLISKALIDTVVPVSAVSIAWSTIQGDLIVIAFKLILNHYANGWIEQLQQFFLSSVSLQRVCWLYPSSPALQKPAICSRMITDFTVAVA